MQELGIRSECIQLTLDDLKFIRRRRIPQLLTSDHGKGDGSVFRSLHMKLVLIMLLLITSLMTIVGAFLMTSITSFYIDQFYEQMSGTFGNDRASFYQALRSEAAGEDGLQRVQQMLEANAGALGIDARSRNYYILDGNSGAVLTGSDEEGAGQLVQTSNLMAARNGEVGDDSDITANYMDFAIPIKGDDSFFIIYIYDNRDTVSDLNAQLFMIIVQALLVGLLISVLLSFLLSKTMTTPIEKLTEGAERVAAGDFSNAITVESSDEIGVLTTTFNDMAAVLEETLAAVETERNKLDTLFLHMTDGVVAFAGDGTIVHCNPAASAMLESAVEVMDYDSLFAGLCPLSELLANVSHELRTPLTNVRSYAETIRDSYDIPREMENGFLDIIIGETDRMTHIVQDLLTLSRLDSGRAELKMLRFPFGDAIESVCRAVELEAQRRGHTLVRSYDIGELPMIVGDRNRLEQVMMNVIGNAIKYTPDGGTIRVSAGSGASKVWMEVLDNGIGIPRQDWNRIFDRFYRVDKARSRESGGTGLGLSIAREIVLRHGGTIGPVEHEGKGTTIRITLPIRQAAQAGEHHE